jgi:pilus assembly protein CpaB
VIGLAGMLVVALGCGLLAVVINRVTGPLPAATAIPPRTVAVVVTTHDIPVRTLLQPDDVTRVDVPVQLAPLEAVSDLEAAVGRITMIPLVTGETIAAHHLADPTNYVRDLAFVIDDDQVLMAFPSTDLMSQLNILQPGDVVDIFVSLTAPALSGPGGSAEDEPSTAFFTFNAMQQVTLSAVVVDIVPARRSGAASSSAVSVGGGEVDIQPLPTPTPQPSDADPEAFLLALDPQDALVLKHIIDSGGIIDIVLRAPTATVRFELSPVMADYLRDRFELVITR